LSISLVISWYSSRDDADAPRSPERPNGVVVDNLKAYGASQKPLKTAILPGMKYRIGEAHAYYKKFIYNEEKQRLFKKHNLPIPGSVPSCDWELFGAILTGDDHKERYGSDLQNHEIKSSIYGASFEYQYHLNGGKKKLLDDMKVDHVFFSYSPDYRNVEVRVVKGAVLKSKFKSWMPGLEANYKGPNRKQRYRRSIPFGTVKKEGVLIMKLEQGELVQVEK